MESLEANDQSWLEAQAQVWRFIFAFADSMAIKCAVELRIADIIHSHGVPITLSQIASCIDSPSPATPCLSRIMRLLVRRKIFTTDDPSDVGEALYGLTSASRWLLHDSEWSLAPMFLFQNHPWSTAPWHCLSKCVKEGGFAFNKAHDCDIWEFASKNPEFNRMLNNGMACTASIVTRGIITGYKDEFHSMGSLVDLGGGTGAMLAEIVKSYPHIKAINFDLPHVVATAPPYDAVEHVGGDMFECIPSADAIIMKWIMHDWRDEECVKILKNCKRAIPEKTGKIIIVDFVLKADGNDVFDDAGLAFDMTMIAHSSGGKERTEPEWKKILEESGFPRFRVIKIPALPSIIEAFPL
ncbi:hypothetical protein K2173_018758 [Erythroxylum novogranatense]|uniref:Uncharacterized protein n=1 Tax=Erythroxylum novogranatense TaxID=1862640 RepID=A0AAV8SAS9_9ROSI|nr:hypothetical protein K2173_018758 [Erythroxylum novogranatense]